MTNSDITGNERSWYLRWWGLSIVFSGVLTFSLLAGFIPILYYGDNNNAGTFGDSFGFVNSLLSAFAFAGVILTLVMQSRELEMQREELVESRKQYEKMAVAQEESEKRLFLTAYLNSLDTLRELTTERNRQQPPTYATASRELECLLVHEDLFHRLIQIVGHIAPDIESTYSLQQRDTGAIVSTRFREVVEEVRQLERRCAGRKTVASLDESRERLEHIRTLLLGSQNHVNAFVHKSVLHAASELEKRVEFINDLLKDDAKRLEYEAASESDEHLKGLKMVTNCIADQLKS